MSLRQITLAVVLAAASGCGAVLEPGTYDEYVLRFVAGEPLPAIFVDHEGGTLRILADTLFLTADGTGREVQRLEFTDKAEGAVQAFTAANELTYTAEDGRLEITYECNDVFIATSCVAPPHLVGLFTPTGLRFTFSLGRAPLEFERVR